MHIKATVIGRISLISPDIIISESKQGIFMKQVLVIALQPYDETLGVGGTILKHIDDGDEVYWLILSKPEETRWSESEYAVKLKEIDEVSKNYGFKSVRRLNFNQHDLIEASRTELIDVLKGNFELIKPDIIYLPLGNEFLESHKAAFEATFKALKSFKLKVKKILCYEIIASYDFRIETFKPNVFVDISDFMENKLQIMNLYETEVEGYPLPKSVDSVRSLAKVHGASIGVEYAEAFMLLREIC